MDMDHYLKKHGFYAAINQNSWMFLSTFKNLRKNIINTKFIDTMLHLGSHTIEEIGGEVVQSTTFVLRNYKINENSIFIRLVDEKTSNKKREKAVEYIKNKGRTNYFSFNQDHFNKIPDSPLSYWASENVVEIFNTGKPLVEFAQPRQGMATADNNRFVRNWYEVSFDNIGFGSKNAAEAKNKNVKWFPYNNGGEYRKWYGNNLDVVNWENDGYEIKQSIIQRYPYLKGNYSFVIKNESKYFERGITWNASQATVYRKGI